MTFWEELGWTAASYAVVALLGGGLAFLVGRRVLGRQPLLPLQRFVPCPWTGGEVLVIFLGFIYLPVLAWQLLHQAGLYGALFTQPISMTREHLWSAPLVLAFFLGLVMSLLWFGRRVRPAQYGLSPIRWRYQVVLGWLGFVILTPIVYALSSLALAVLPQREHVFLKVAQENLLEVEWGLLVLQAIIAAPIIEELAFRGILLGWLKRASLPGLIMLGLFTLLMGASPLLEALSKDEGPLPPWGTLIGPLVLAVALVAIYGVLLAKTWNELKPRWALLQTGVPPREELPDDDEPDPGPPPLPPWVLFSQADRPPGPWQTRLILWGQAMLFAIIHPAWPAPIPLLALALGLGWLAYRTNSIVAPIVVHLLFNLVATLLLFVPPKPLVIGPVHEWLTS